MQELAGFLTGLIVQGYLGLFIACFLINMLPFAPSNMVLAGVAKVLLPYMGWVEIGIIVAAAATLAKVVHYYLVRTSRVVLSEENLSKLDRERERVEKWGPLAMFFAAGSPFPDDPIIVYVALTKYNVVKSFVSYYLGKVLVTLAGAFIGGALGELFGSIPMIIASLALTLLITAYLFTREREETPVIMETDNAISDVHA